MCKRLPTRIISTNQQQKYWLLKKKFRKIKSNLISSYTSWFNYKEANLNKISTALTM